MKKLSLLNIIMISICISFSSTIWADCDSNSVDEGSEILFDNFIGEDENNIYIDSKEAFWNSKRHGESHSSENPVFVLPKSNIAGIYQEDIDSFYKRELDEYNIPDSNISFTSVNYEVVESNLYVDGILIDYIENYHDSSDPDILTNIYVGKAILPNSNELIFVSRVNLPTGFAVPNPDYINTLYIKNSSKINMVDMDDWFVMYSTSKCSNGSIIFFGKTDSPVFYHNSAYIMDKDMNMVSAADFVSQKLGVGIAQNRRTKNIFVIGMSGENIVMLVAPNQEESIQEQLVHSDIYGFYNLNGHLSIEKRIESFDAFSKLQHEVDDISSDEMHVSSSDHIYAMSDSFDSLVDMTSGEKFEIHKFGEEMGKFKKNGNATISMDGVFSNKKIPLYTYRTNTCICAEDLVNYGFDMKWDTQKRRTSFSMTGMLKEGKNNNLYEGPIYKSDIGIYVNGKYIESFNTGGYSLISMADLEFITDYKVEFNSK